MIRGMYSIFMLLYIVAFIKASTHHQSDTNDKLSGLIIIGSKNQITAVTYDAPSNPSFVVNIPKNTTDIYPYRLQIDQELGWFYFAYPADNSNTRETSVEMSRTNIITNKSQKILSNGLSISGDYKGFEYYFTFPSITLDTEQSSIFFTPTDYYYSTKGVYRLLTNGADYGRITRENSEQWPTAVTHDKKFDALYVVKKKTQTDFFPTYYLHVMDTDGFNARQLDTLFEFDYNSVTSVTKLQVDTRFVASMYDLPRVVFLYWLYKDRNSNSYGFGYFAGDLKTQRIIYETSKYFITDFAYDPNSESIVFVTRTLIMKGQIGRNQQGKFELMNIRELGLNISTPLSVVVTPSNCSRNCFLNGRCIDKKCACLPNFYPFTTCERYCTNSTCNNNGFCLDDGTCQCNLNYGGDFCDKLQLSPSVFPQRLVMKNITVVNTVTNKLDVINTVYMDQPKQMLRVDYANGTTVIDRYDQGFSFTLNGNKCTAVGLEDSLDVFRVPADSIYKGKIACGLTEDCLVWWSASSQIEYNVFFYQNNYFPIIKKDIANKKITYFDLSKMTATTPDKSFFNYPSSCI